MLESGFSRREVLEVQLATEEICVNIILHAYANRAGIFRICAKVKGDRLNIAIEDDGPPFDLTKHKTLKHVATENNEGPVGGWGIGLIKALMDEVKYERRDGKNILNLVKKHKH